MKKMFPLILVTLLVFGCKKQLNQNDNTVDKATIAKASFATTEKAELVVSGMTCAVGCAGTIQKNLAKVEGVQSAEVDFERQLAMVEYNPSKVILQDLENTIHKTSDAYKVIHAKNVDTFSKKDSTEEQSK